MLVPLDIVSGVFKKINESKKHIVEVTPNRNAKEVIWLEGRRHFVMLDPTEASKKCSMPRTEVVLKGSEVTLRSCDTMTRIAHNRRAHTRTLRSARYKNKRGSIIYIKENWIGPKKWIDKTQSIYKVLASKEEVLS
jgi:hypothetical protein